MTNVTTIGAETVFEYIFEDGHRTPVDVTLAYSENAPFVVSVELRTAQDSTTWMIGRELLGDGLVTPSGAGDIRMRPLSGDVAVLELGAADEQARFQVCSDELREFLESTYEMVAPGAEWDDLQMAAELMLLLG